MNKENYLNRYAEFVDAVTSDESKDLEKLIARLKELQNNNLGINIARLLTGSVGLCSESGEFDEIVKKMLFQGKPLTEDIRFHLYRELGDIAWYWINAATALNIDPYKVLDENINKLKSCYPGGEFDPYYSENRKTGDI